ncbi:MAG: histone deacetylase family protein [Thermoplasmata archaeon]
MATLFRAFVAIFYNEEFLSHVQDPFHPESPERLRGIVQKLKQHGLWKDVISSRAGRPETLKLVHDEDYIEFIKTSGECALTLDTMVHNETYEIAALSAECAVDAARYSKEKGKPAFALTRPPGHHAGKDYGMGFCYFNNISIAATYLLKNGDKRIAIVDEDVHHGNGTEEIFAADPNVLYISTHQSGTFPGTGQVEYVGKGEGEGFTVNMPLPSGSGDSTFDVAFSDVIRPILTQFKPDAILVSWGVDTHYKDMLASLTLSSEGHVRQAAELMKLARMCGNRITFMLEGGYYVPALAEVVAGVIGHAEGIDVPMEFTDIVDNSCLGRNTIERCRQIVSQYWSL